MSRPHPVPVAQSAASLLTSRFAVAAIALLFLGVSTRLLSLEEIALFAVYNVLCGALTVICSLGMLASCIKLVPALSARGEWGAMARLLSLSIRIYVIGALLTGLALVALADGLATLLVKDPGRAGDVRVAVVAAVCFGLYEASQLLLSALQRFGDLGRFNFACALAQRILSLGLFFPFGLRGYLAGFAIGSLVGAGLGFGRIIPAIRAARHEAAAGPAGASEAIHPVRFAFPFYADGFLRYLYMHADQLLVGILLPPAALSIYFVAKRFLAYGNVVVSSLVDPLGARAAEREGDAAGDLAGMAAASLRWTLALFLPLSGLLACMSPFLLAVVGGAPYAEGAWPLALLFLSLPAFAVFSLLGVFVHALGRPADRLAVNVIASLAQGASILLFAAGMRSAGIASAVAALAGLAAARVLGFSAGALYARRVLGGRLKGSLSPGSRFLAGAAFSTGAMMAILSGAHLWTGRPLLQPLFVLPAVLVCLAGYRWLVMEPEDFLRLAGTIPDRGLVSRLLSRRLAGPAGGDR